MTPDELTSETTKSKLTYGARYRLPRNQTARLSNLMKLKRLRRC